MTVIVFRPVTKAESYDPPEGVRDAAARAVAWIQEGKAGDGFTAVGRKRASDLAAGRSISVDTLRRMSSYFARHEVDRDAEGFNSGEDGFPSPGRVAWDAWGGDAGRSWVRSVFSEVEKHYSHNQQDHAGGRGANDAPVNLDSRNPDDLRAAFEQTLITPDGAEYQVKVINASGDIYSIVTGEIVDSNGERVGFFQRKLKNDQMVMNNSLLTINESHQGRGIATEFQKASERAAMSLGMEGITIDAVSDGSRAWATERFGFEFRAEPYGLRRVQRELKSSGGNAALDELAARFKTTDKTKWPRPHEILALGPIGERILDEGWNGQKPSSRVTKQTAEKMFYITVFGVSEVEKHGSHNQQDHAGKKATNSNATSLIANQPTNVAASDVAATLSALENHEGAVDLTKLSVDGQKVFSEGNLGISREDMPQIPKKHREQFLDETRARGVQVTDESVDPRTLIPTQSEMNAVNVAGMRASMLDGSFPMTGQRILVSSDGHVLDGHHRWAALTAIAYERPGTTIDVTRVNMPIRDLLVSAADFNDRMGIESRGLGDFGSKVRKALGLPSKFSVLVFGPLGKHYSHNQKDHAGKGGAGMEEVEKAINERIQVRAKELGVELKVGATQQEEQYFDRQNAKAVVAADISQRMSDIPVEDVAGAAQLEYDPRILEDSGGAFYVRLERGQVSLVEAPTDLSGKKLENWKSEAATRGLVPSGTPEAEEYLRRAAVSQLVDNWATSSNDHHPGSLAIQDAATRHFGLSQVAPWDEMPSQKVLTQKYGAVYERFVAAQHESTQEMFKAAGITHVTVYRGLISDHPENLPGVGDAVSVISRPLSSWTTHENTANAFATNYSVVFDPSSAAGRMMKTVVPIEDVVSSAATGNGCKNEFELVLRGGVSTVSVYEPGYVFDGSD